MFEKAAEFKNESSNRRRFLYRIVGLGAAAGAASLLLNRDKSLMPLAQAGSGTGDTVDIDVVNYGVGQTELRTTADNNAAFFGVATNGSGNTYGVYGQSNSISGRGVYGWVGNSSGFTYGVYGSSDSIDGLGVYGYASNASGTTYGVYGVSSSISGRGVHGYANNASGITFGVYGSSDSIDGSGIYGLAGNLSGITYGVYGQSDSISGYGVYGFASNASGTTRGVYGSSSSIDGRGVEGYSNNATGMNAGVYGHSLRGAGVVGGADRYNAIPLIAWGASGQTDCLQEWIDSNTNTLAVIDKAGFLGVGTSSPSTPIHVKSSSSNPAVRLENENQHVGQFIYCYSSSGQIPFFSGRRARGTIASPTAVQTNDILMRYGGSGYGTSAFPGGNRAILEFKAAQNWTDTNQGTYITFSTTPNNSATAAERMRITDAGEIIPPTDNTGSIGTASRRWSLVRATTVTSGDLTFENSFIVTEDEKIGLAFKNDAGEKIAVLDRQGNIHIKGDIIKDL